MIEKTQQAFFAGGCFWCLESIFQETPGVKEVVSGYMGGTKDNPSYEEVSLGKTGHKEAVKILYYPEIITYDKLLEIFWQNIDPMDDEGQFVDRGTQYRTAIFYENEEQKKRAEDSKKWLEGSGIFHKPITTEILKAGNFYQAEEYHQDFYLKQPAHYLHYKAVSGRDQFFKKTWHDKQKCPLPNLKVKKQLNTKDLKENLSNFQYHVTQENGTEPAFQNEYWNNEKEGIYIDVVSGEPLFSSMDKFDSGTGWPSFTKPLEPANIVQKEDNTFFTKRIEVRSKNADSHLGHVFEDGPNPTGLRYCINSAALKFIPKEDLEKYGYGEFKRLFTK